MPRVWRPQEPLPPASSKRRRPSRRASRSSKRFASRIATIRLVSDPDFEFEAEEKIRNDNVSSASNLRAMAPETASIRLRSEVVSRVLHESLGIISTGPDLTDRLPDKHPCRECLLSMLPWYCCCKGEDSRKGQNKLLLHNTFHFKNGIVKYVVHSPCVRAFLKVGTNRLSRLRKVKEQVSSGGLTADEHGLCNKPSNHSEPLAHADLELHVNSIKISTNRSVGAKWHLPEHIASTKGRAPSLVSTFQAWQAARNVHDAKRCLAPTSIANAWKKKFAGHTLHPHKTDACSMCVALTTRKSNLKEELQNGCAGLRSLGNAQLRQLDDELRAHKADAARSRAWYNATCAPYDEMRGRLTEDQWRRCMSITDPDPPVEDIARVAGVPLDTARALLRVHSTLLISADYQMDKMIPRFGKSAEPSNVFYEVRARMCTHTHTHTHAHACTM